MALRGSPELRARLKAIRLVFKDSGRAWADETARIAKPMVPVRTGATRASIRRRNASQRLATVVGNYPVNFIDAGTKAHDIKAKRVSVLKFQTDGGTLFRKKVHKRATTGNRFKARAAQEGLRRVDPLDHMVDLWNEAA